MLPEVSQVSAQLPHRDRSEGTRTALAGECAVNSAEQPGLGQGLSAQAALAGSLSTHSLGVPSTWAGETASQAPHTPFLQDALWKIPSPCSPHHKAPLIVALCHQVPSQCPSVLLAGKHPVPEAAPVIKGLNAWFSIWLILALARSHGLCRGPEGKKS